MVFFSTEKVQTLDLTLQIQWLKPLSHQGHFLHQFYLWDKSMNFHCPHTALFRVFFLISTTTAANSELWWHFEYKKENGLRAEIHFIQETSKSLSCSILTFKYRKIGDKKNPWIVCYRHANGLQNAKNQKSLSAAILY